MYGFVDAGKVANRPLQLYREEIQGLVCALSPTKHVALKDTSENLVHIWLRDGHVCFEYWVQLPDPRERPPFEPCKVRTWTLLGEDHGKVVIGGWTAGEIVAGDFLELGTEELVFPIVRLPAFMRAIPG